MLVWGDSILLQAAAVFPSVVVASYCLDSVAVAYWKAYYLELVGAL